MLQNKALFIKSSISINRGSLNRVSGVVNFTQHDKELNFETIVYVLHPLPNHNCFDVDVATKRPSVILLKT